jgi:uncharacterized protein YdhG (YjbR/CyaY superfamily)
MVTEKAEDVSTYINGLPANLRDIAESIRAAIRGAVPECEESIKYGMPAYALGGCRFIYFAVWKKHVGLYPIYRHDSELEARLAPFRSKKDTVQFDLKQPISLELVARVARAQAAR